MVGLYAITLNYPLTVKLETLTPPIPPIYKRRCEGLSKFLLNLKEYTQTTVLFGITIVVLQIIQTETGQLYVQAAGGSYLAIPFEWAFWCVSGFTKQRGSWVHLNLYQAATCTVLYGIIIWYYYFDFLSFILSAFVKKWHGTRSWYLSQKEGITFLFMEGNCSRICRKYCYAWAEFWKHTMYETHLTRISV